MSQLSDDPSTTTKWLSKSWTPLNILWPIAVKHFNDRNGDIVPEFALLKNKCPIKINLTMVDDSGSPSQTMRVFMEAFTSSYTKNNNNNNIHAILGPVTSDSAIPLATTSGVLQIPEVAHLAIVRGLNDMTRYPYFVRTCPSNEVTGTVLTIALKQMGYKNLGIVYQDEATSVGWSTILSQSWQTNSTNHKVFTLSFDDTKGLTLDESINIAVQRIAEIGINVWFIVGSSVGYIRAFARSVTKYQLLKRNMLFITTGGSILDDEYNNVDPLTSTLEEDHEMIKNFLLGSLAVQFSTTSTTTTTNNPLKILKQLWPTFNVKDINPYLPTKLINNISYQLPWNYFNNTSILDDMDDRWGYTYDAAALVGIAACQAYADGQDFKQGEIYNNYIFNASFHGASGLVRILPNGDRDISSHTSLLQIAVRDDNNNNDLSYVTWGQLLPNNNTWQFGLNSVYFRDGTKQPPPDHEQQTENKNYLPLWCLIIGGIEIVLVLSMSIWSGSWMATNQTNEVMINSQPTFMYVILLGVTVLGFAIVPLLIEESNEACMAFPWLYALGMTLCVTPLALKAQRVVVLWHNPGTFRYSKGMGRRYLFSMLIVIMVEIVILIAWSLNAPMMYERIPISYSELGDVVSSYGICTFSNIDKGIAYLSTIAVFNAILVIWMGIITCKARDAPEKFQEAKWTALAGASISGVYFLGIPIVIVVYVNSIARFLVFSAICCLSAIVISMCVFVPKIINIVKLRSSQEQQDPASNFNNSNSPRRSQRRMGNQNNVNNNMNTTTMRRASLTSPRQVTDSSRHPSTRVVMIPIDKETEFSMLQSELNNEYNNKNNNGQVDNDHNTNNNSNNNGSSGENQGTSTLFNTPIMPSTSPQQPLRTTSTTTSTFNAPVWNIRIISDMSTHQDGYSPEQHEVRTLVDGNNNNNAHSGAGGVINNNNNEINREISGGGETTYSLTLI
jgi:ABC-type branched-subunit amino acid transport system substrate-binding protein